LVRQIFSLFLDRKAEFLRFTFATLYVFMVMQINLAVVVVGVIVKILEVAFTQILNNYRGSAVRDIRTPLGRFKLI